MTLPTHINTRKKEKFELTNGNKVSVRTIDKSNILSLMTGIMADTTYDSVVATAVNDTTVNYVFYDGVTAQNTVAFVYTSDSDWSLTKT